MSTAVGEGRPQRPNRPPLSTTVVRAEDLTPHVRRIVVAGPDLADFDPSASTDSYVKLLLAGVKRTYTVRAFDAATTELTLDVVIHGDAGVAGPWAARARPGDRLELLGPGGGYRPDPAADWHLLVGDASALPAIAVALEVLASSARAVAVIEVEDAAEEQPLTSPAQVRVRWAHRAGAAPAGAPEAAPGAALLVALEEELSRPDLPPGRPQVFLHGEAASVREARRRLRADLGVAREELHASGYWRLGRDDEGWRAEKRDWAAAVERDDDSLVGPPLT